MQHLAAGSPRPAVWLERPTNDEAGNFVLLHQLFQSRGHSFVIVVPPGVVVRPFVVGNVGYRFYCRDTIIGRGMSCNGDAYSFVGDVQSHNGAVDEEEGRRRRKEAQTALEN